MALTPAAFKDLHPGLYNESRDEWVKRRKQLEREAKVEKQEIERKRDAKLKQKQEAAALKQQKKEGE